MMGGRLGRILFAQRETDPGPTQNAPSKLSELGTLGCIVVKGNHTQEKIGMLLMRLMLLVMSDAISTVT